MSRKYVAIWWVILWVFMMGAACSSKKKRMRDKSINNQTSFNPIFLDSTLIAEFFKTNPEMNSFQEQYNDFYSDRNFEYAWFDSTGLSEQAHNFFNLQNNYTNSLNDSSIYSPKLNEYYNLLNGKSIKAIETSPQILQTELLLTGQFFKYAAKVYKGAGINAAELGWFIPRKKIDLTALLDSVILKKATEPDQFAPLNSQYKLLEKSLAQYVELQKREIADTIAWVKKSYKVGDSSAQMILIKQRLLLLEPSVKLNNDIFYDSALLVSVKKFQHRMGLTEDGAIGNKMIVELNVPVRKRVQQILVNMERIRWMPPENDSNYIIVNIPEYKMRVYDSGKLAYDMNVIVGSAANSSVIFNGNLKYIVFSPFWNVPESIVRAEILPGIRKNGNYLAKHNMEIIGQSGGLPIVRQNPGPKNSLGLVKFLFPNNYSIYFHDTPNRNLFSQTSRNLSHGCIRLGEPVKFARYLLRNDTINWPDHKIDSAMHLEKEKWVTLKKSVPVFLVYFTAWVDKSGELNFRKDIYGHDKKMVDKLF